MAGWTWIVEHLTVLAALGAAACAVGAGIGAYRDQRAQLAAVTGGESFVYLEPLRKGGKVKYFVRHTGKHPTFDVVVRVQEVFYVLGPSPSGKEKRKLIFGPADAGRTLLRGSGFDWTYPDPTYSDKREWPLIFTEPPPADAAPRVFRIELAARNGIVVQRVRVWPVGDRWHTEVTLVRRPGAGHPLALPADYEEAQAQPGNREEYDDAE